MATTTHLSEGHKAVRIHSDNPDDPTIRVDLTLPRGFAEKLIAAEQSRLEILNPGRELPQQHIGFVIETALYAHLQAHGN